MKDETVIREYLDEINGFTNTGIWMYEDEVPYCQAKYNKCLAFAIQVGGLDVLAAALQTHIPSDKQIVLPEEDMQGWPPLWRVVQQYQCCRLEDMPQYEVAFGCELPEWSEAGWTPEELAQFAKCDAYNNFVAEMCMLNAVFMAASEHC